MAPYSYFNHFSFSMKYLVFGFALTLFSCSSSDTKIAHNEVRYLQEYFVSDKIDSLFQSAEVVVSISLDSLTEDRIVRKKSVRRVYIDSLKSASESLFSYPIKGMDFTDRATIVASSSDDKVVVLDLKGNSILKSFIGGKGPSEFKAPEDIVSNVNYIAISEYGNMRVQVFNGEMQYLRTTPLKSLHSSNRLGLSGNYLILVDNISDNHPILNSVNIETGEVNFTPIPNLFLGENYAAYNSLSVRSDENYIAITSSGSPYILIYDKSMRFKYFIQIKSSKTEMLLDRIRKTLEDSKSVSEKSAITFIQDFAINDNVLYVNTFEAGRIISVDLNLINATQNLQWNVYDAARPKRSESPTLNASIQPITMRFAVYGNTMLVYDLNKDNEFFDIIQY